MIGTIASLAANALGLFGGDEDQPYVPPVKEPLWSYGQRTPASPMRAHAVRSLYAEGRAVAQEAGLFAPRLNLEPGAFTVYRINDPLNASDTGQRVIEFSEAGQAAYERDMAPSDPAQPGVPEGLDWRSLPGWGIVAADSHVAPASTPPAGGALLLLLLAGLWLWQR